MPVDIVTGDRDLFQLVDDARDVRVIYTARGMSKLEMRDGCHGGRQVRRAAEPVRRLRDAARRRIRRAARRRGHRREDRGEPAAQFRDLDGIIAAAADPGDGMSAAMRGSASRAPPHTSTSPRPSWRSCATSSSARFDAEIRPLGAERVAEVARLASEWNLGGSAERALRALGNEVAGA